MANPFLSLLILFYFLVYSECRNKCYPDNSCEKSKYRSIDGSCNNFQHPNWGKSMTGYNRLLPAAFSDGIYAPRKSVTGKSLPDARLLSRTLLTDHDANDKINTLFSMQFGQFISHDMSHAYATEPDRKLKIQDQNHTDFASADNPTCCNDDFTQKLNYEKGTDVPCMALSLKKDDPMMMKFGQGCMDFRRGKTDECSDDKAARTLTSSTHFLDCSNLYGTNRKIAKKLREMKGGRLQAIERHGEWPPSKEKCPFLKQKVCFMTGDPERSDSTLGLASMHVLMLREHNRVARKLEELNPHWSDEVLYQEARRIVIAEYQYITYHEWITKHIGKKRAQELGIYDSDWHGYSNRYDSHVNPSVFTEHANGEMRAFHANIKGKLRVYSERLKIVIGNYDLNKYTFNPEVLTERRNFDDVLLGLVSQPQLPMGPFHSKAVTEYLFRHNGGKFGFDLKALDILRERSEGLPGYNYYREFCGLRAADQFEDLSDEIDPKLIEKLKSLYEDPDDIDLTIGGLLEKKLPQSELGPTNTCIFMRQFNNTRNADSYFYDRGNYMGAFSPAQLSEIHKASMSRILCDNTKISQIQREAFSISAFYKISTLSVPCATLPKIDLTQWKEIKHPERTFVGNQFTKMFGYQNP